MLRRSLRYGCSFQFRCRSSVAAIKAEHVDSSYMEQLQAEWLGAKPFKEIPGPTRWQMWRGFQRGGELEHLDMQELILLFRKRYGETYLMPGAFGMPSNVVTFNVDSFEKVFRTEGQWPVRTGFDVMIHYREKRADGFFKNCLGLISNGEQWGRLRSAANPVLMQHRNTAAYLQPMQRVNQQFIQLIRELRDTQTLEVPGDFLKDVNHLTFESVAVVALDREMGLIRNAEKSPEAQKLFNNIEIVMKSFYDLGIKPSFYKYVPTPTYRRFSRAMDEILDTSTRYINEALERIENRAVNTTASISVLEQLLRIDRKFAIVLAMDLMMAGVDTTSSVLVGIMLNLAKNPKQQAKLREEILSKLPHTSQEFTLSDMKTLPYLRACIKESLRIYPIIFGNMRQAGANIMLDGYRIPKGTPLMLNSNMLLKEERFYPRAKEFLPERWLRQQQNDTNIETLIANDLSPFIYLPFGFGPRMCAGKRIVDMELELTVANLVRNFQIEFNYSTENAYKCRFINTPVIPLKFKFTDIKY